MEKIYLTQNLKNFYNRLNFNYHISNICKTANKKLNALARVSNHADQDKRRILFNSYTFYVNLITAHLYG